MNDNITVFLTITAMGLVTYGTRISGFLAFSRVKNMPRSVRRILEYIPGTIIISIIAPQVAGGGWVTLSASALCVAVSLAVGNMVAAMAVTVVYVSLLRNFF